MIEMYTLMNLWKVIWMEIPQQLANKLEVDEHMLVRLKRPRLLTCRLGFLWRAKELFNELPIMIRKDANMLSFKRRVRKYIIEKRKKTTKCRQQYGNQHC